MQLVTDQYKTVVNCFKSALWVRAQLLENKPVAIPLTLGNGTMFHISFVPLQVAVPSDCIYVDGSNRGIQINIDRNGSYALPIGISIGETNYLSEKWKISTQDGEYLLPFLNTVLTGENHFSNL